MQVTVPKLTGSITAAIHSPKEKEILTNLSTALEKPKNSTKKLKPSKA
jgi:hypothetical protein